MTTHAINTLGQRVTTADAGTPSTERLLRMVLAANAATSFVAGAIGALAAGWTADTLGTDAVGWTRGTSIVLAIFAVDVALMARACGPRLRQFAALVSSVDIAWVLATAAVVAFGGLSGTGVAIAVVLALGVADFAAAQLWFRHRMRR
jgi:hypothetical protein